MSTTTSRCVTPTPTRAAGSVAVRRSVSVIEIDAWLPDDRAWLDQRAGEGTPLSATELGRLRHHVEQWEHALEVLECECFTAEAAGLDAEAEQWLHAQVSALVARAETLRSLPALRLAA